MVYVDPSGMDTIPLGTNKWAGLADGGFHFADHKSAPKPISRTYPSDDMSTLVSEILAGGSLLGPTGYPGEAFGGDDFWGVGGFPRAEERWDQSPILTQAPTGS